MLDIGDFLIMPVQRLPRLELLLKDQLKNTETSSPDYSKNETAYEQIKQMTSSINEHKKQTDSMQRLMAIQQKVKGKNKVRK